MWSSDSKHVYIGKYNFEMLLKSVDSLLLEILFEMSRTFIASKLNIGLYAHSVRTFEDPIELGFSVFKADR